MRSTEVLSAIGRDLGKLLLNNDTTLSVLRNPGIKSHSQGRNDAEIMLREDLHDFISTDRELVKLLHLAIKDFEITQAELKDVDILMEPDIGQIEPSSDQFPDPAKADEYFSNEGLKQKNLLDKYPFLRDRMKGDFGND